MDHAIDRAIDVLPWPVLAGLVGCYAIGWLIKTLRRQPNWSYTLGDRTFKVAASLIVITVAGYYVIQVALVFFPTRFAPDERGIYVAKFKADEKNVAQSYVIELINLEAATNPALKGVHTRSIGRELDDSGEAAKLCASTHAVLCVWGVFIPPKPVFVKLSTPGSDAVAERLFDDYSQMRDLSGLVVQAIHAATKTPEMATKDNALDARVTALELADQRIEAGLGQLKGATNPPPDRNELTLQLNEAKAFERTRQRHALVVGISNYGNGLPRLLFPAADARAVSDQFRQLWPAQSRSTVLLDEKATRAEILSAMDKIEKESSAGDQVWIYLSGHTISKDGRSLFLPFDGDATDLRKNGIELQEIFGWLKRIRASQGLMFVDTCYSGSFLANYSRGINISRLPPSFDGSGQAAFSATGQDQLAYESPQFHHGLFTYALLEGLGGNADINGDGIITTQELSAYIRERVGEASSSLGFRQNPSFYTTGLGGNIAVAEVVSATASATKNAD
jgi:hypothetical protein